MSHDDGYDGRGRAPYLPRRTPVDRIDRWNGQPLPPEIFDAAKRQGMKTWHEWVGRVQLEAVVAAVYLAGFEAAMVQLTSDRRARPGLIIDPKDAL